MLAATHSSASRNKVPDRPPCGPDSTCDFNFLLLFTLSKSANFLLDITSYTNKNKLNLTFYYYIGYIDTMSRSSGTPSDEQGIMRALFKQIFVRAITKLQLDVDSDFLDTMIRRLEREAFNYTIRQCENVYTDRRWTNPNFVSIYSSICYKIMSNIDPASSINTEGGLELVKDILMRKREPKEVCYLNSHEMNPKVSQIDRDVISNRLGQTVDRKFTSKYQCKKCGERKAVYHEFQGKGGDEISTIKYECIECGHFW